MQSKHSFRFPTRSPFHHFQPTLARQVYYISLRTAAEMTSLRPQSSAMQKLPCFNATNDLLLSLASPASSKPREMIGARVSTWLLSVFSLVYAYPEAILLLGSILLVRRLNRSRKKLVRDWPVLRILANITRVHDWITDLLRRRGGTVVLKGPRFSQLHMMLTCDPENINYISNRANFANFPKGRDYAERFDILGDGILNADGDSWQLQRKWGHRLMRDKDFRHNIAKTSQEKVEKGLIPLIDHMAQRNEPVDLQDVFQRYTFDVSCLLICGTDPGGLYHTFPDVPFLKAMDDASEVILLRHAIPTAWWKLQRCLRVGNERKIAAARRTIDHVIYNLISSRKLELKTTRVGEEPEQQRDLLTTYMTQPTDDADMERLRSDDLFLRDSVMNMLAAGRNTTSAALTWFFWELSRHPHVEAKILSELRATKTEEAAPFKVYEAAEANGLMYLHAALMECLRLYPSVPLVLKGVESPDTLPSGQRVVPGMRIVMTLYGLGRTASVWGEDCLEFKPERWLTPEGTPRYDMHHKFLVFSTGPRSCLGRDLSLTQMKVVAASLIHNFHVRVVAGQRASPAISVTLQMKNGLTVKVARRGRSVDK